MFGNGGRETEASHVLLIYILTTPLDCTGSSCVALLPLPSAVPRPAPFPPGREMCEQQQQIAVGLRDAVKRWCLPVCNAHLASAEFLEGPCGAGAEAQGTHFLDQLLLVGSLSDADAVPLPVHLFQEETGGSQDWRSLGTTGDATLTPNSCSGASTFRSGLGVPPYPNSGSHDADRDNSTEEPPTSLSFIEQRHSDTGTYDGRSQATPEARDGITSGGSLPIDPQGNPGDASLHLSPLLGTEGPELPGSETSAGQDLPAGLSYLRSTEVVQASRPTAAAPTAAAPRTAGIATPITESEHQEQRKQQQQQQQQAQVSRHLRSSAAPTLASKGMKRRPEALSFLRGTSRGGPQNASSPAAASAGPAGGPSTRPDGPPQKRQAVAVARRRGEPAPPARSNTISNISTKALGTSLAPRRAASALVKSSSGRVVHSSNSCKLSLSNSDASARPKPQSPAQPQQQHQKLQAEPSPASATDRHLAYIVRRDAHKGTRIAVASTTSPICTDYTYVRWYLADREVLLFCCVISAGVPR